VVAQNNEFQFAPSGVAGHCFLQLSGSTMSTAPSDRPQKLGDFTVNFTRLYISV